MFDSSTSGVRVSGIKSTYYQETSGDSEGMDAPLLVYSIPSTEWHIVITEQAHHFYFNSETKQSVWQISDVSDISGFSVDELSEKIDFNQVALLMGEANGVSAQKLESRKARKVGPQQSQEKSPQPEPELEPEEPAEQEDPEPVPEPEEPEDSKDLAQSEQPEPEQPAGLSLGYSSEELEEEREAEDDGDDENGDNEDEEEEDINAGLDLSVGEEEEDESEAFKQILLDNKDKFSVFDPWTLVEEELTPILVEEGGFYSLDEKKREKLYEEWAAENGEAEQQKGTFPTDTLLFYKNLQQQKQDVRKLFYPQFKAKYPELLGVPNEETLYRKLRVTLNDFAEYEKATKKAGGAKGNLKVEKVATFVREGLPKTDPKTVDLGMFSDDFDKWMHLCNEHELPVLLVEDPVNFIVGDEKRVQIYLAAVSRDPARDS